jgi:AcrR family transcriptional regulator
MADKSEETEDTARRGYHHGNLRQALVGAALGLIEKSGPNGFSFAEAARAAGVSPAAPYRHFKDRDALLAEIARQGFDLFAERMERALEKAGPSPMRGFEAVTSAYLAFARDEEAYFQAMFQSGTADRPEVLEAGERAFATLRRACEGLVRHLPENQRPPIHMMSYHIWALSHGIAELFGQRDTRGRAPIEAAELLEAGAAIYLRGLGLIPED